MTTRTAQLIILSALVAGCAAGPELEPITITNGQGEIAGEVTADSVILHSRLTTEAVIVDGDVPGAPGVARFELATAESFAEAMESPWLEAIPDRDFVVQAKMAGLTAGTRYYYRLRYGPGQDNTRVGPTRSFSTLPGADGAMEVNFVVVTGMNYNPFHADGPRAGSPEDKALGYPALDTILGKRPEFFVATGDNVYYDVPFNRFERTQAFMRQKWHEQLVQPRFIDLFAEVPTYWEKDDHDYRYNDTDNTVETEPDPSPELGAATFLEQVPVVDPNDPNPLTYRTHRVSRDLQIWLTEGRDYRSPNMAPQGPDKTLWGAEQLAWLKRTLLESERDVQDPDLADADDRTGTTPTRRVDRPKATTRSSGTTTRTHKASSTNETPSSTGWRRTTSWTTTSTLSSATGTGNTTRSIRAASRSSRPGRWSTPTPGWAVTLATRSRTTRTR